MSPRPASKRFLAALAKSRDRPPSSPRARELDARPMCAVCGHMVERLIEEEDDQAQRLVFTAVCHGQRERVVLDEDVVRGGRGISFGVAFASSPRRIEAGTP